MSLAARRPRVWVVVLAAGQGKRVAMLTQGANGRSVPKQYSTVTGGPTLLERALGRAQRLASLSQTVVIVAEPHRCFWEPALSHLPPENVVPQPEDRGTAIGILLASQRVLAQDPRAHLLFLPSDHFVEDERRLGASLREAVESLQTDPSRLVLIGVPCQAADAEYGWIVPSAGSGRRDVLAFREKPDIDEAQSLRRGGALLNTFMFAVTSATLLDLYTRALPGVLASFEQALGDRLALPIRDLQALYSRLPTVDFSREVLEAAPDRLVVLPARPCGWADLGTPARLEQHRRGQAGTAASSIGHRATHTRTMPHAHASS